jgi:hypothetical protein
MIDSKKTILQYDKETIVLDELSIADEMKAGDKKAVQLSGNREEIDIGFGMPLIKINAYQVLNISYFKLDLSSKIPTLLLRFIPEDETFLFTSYPKDGDLLSLFIRSTSQIYKPIRMDMLITDVLNGFPPLLSSTGNPKEDRANANNSAFTIKAQMRIPGLLEHVSRSFNGKTSYQVVRQIAKDLGLGFASNEKETSDSMNWICPNKTYYKFLDDVCNSAWKGEEDFFDWWIDHNYVLNFVNLRRQLLEKSVDDQKVLQSIGIEKGVAGGLDSNTKPGEVDLPLFLTNDYYYQNYPFFIKAYSVKNAAGYITNNFGYKRDLQFYDTKLVSDRPVNKYVKYEIESVTEKNLGPSSIIFKGRVNEDVYKKEKKKTWVGTQYGENQHKNIQQALIQNRINRYENFKVYLETQMHAFIPWVYRGQTVPTRIVHGNAMQSKTEAQEGKDKEPYDSGQHGLGKKVDNKFLSGTYMIMGSYIEYIDSKITQSLVLGKREWLINDGRGSDPEPAVKT